MATNVLGPNRQAERLLALVHEYRPDVLVTLETDSWWEAHLDQLSDDYPHSIRCPQDNLYGMHVFAPAAGGAGTQVPGGRRRTLHACPGACR